MSRDNGQEVVTTILGSMVIGALTGAAKKKSLSGAFSGMMAGWAFGMISHVAKKVAEDSLPYENAGEIAVEGVKIARSLLRDSIYDAADYPSDDQFPR